MSNLTLQTITWVLAFGLQITSIARCQTVCRRPDFDENVISITPNQSSYTIYSAIELSCLGIADTLSGGNSLFTCQESTLWRAPGSVECDPSSCTSSLHCLGPCSLSSVDDDVDFDGPTLEVEGNILVRDGIVVKFGCDGVLIGSDILTCSDTYWSDAFPICQAECRLEDLVGYLISNDTSDTTRQHGETLTYQCGTESIQVTCDDGAWMSDTECSLTTTSLPRVTTVTIAPTIVVTTTHTPTATESTTVAVTPTRVSTTDVTNTMLSTDVKTAEVLTTLRVCRRPDFDENLISINPNQSSYNLYDVIKLSCLGVADTLTGPSLFLCLPSTLWSVTVSVECDPSSCASLLDCLGPCSLRSVDDDVDFDGETVEVEGDILVRDGMVVMFSCDGVLVGNDALTCSDTVWSGTFPSCQAECRLEDLEGYLISNDTSDTTRQHGETLTYQCGTESIEVTCDDGAWMSNTECSLTVAPTIVVTTTLPPTATEPTTVTLTPTGASTTDVTNTEMLSTDVKTAEVLTTLRVTTTSLTSVTTDTIAPTIVVTTTQPPTTTEPTTVAVTPTGVSTTDVTNTEMLSTDVKTSEVLTTLRVTTTSLTSVTTDTIAPTIVVTTTQPPTTTEPTTVAVTPTGVSTADVTNTEMLSTDVKTSEVLPTLKGLCSLSSVDDDVDFDGETVEVEGDILVRHGTVVMFRCDGALVGNDALTCSDTDWSGTFPTCQADCRLEDLEGYLVSDDTSRKTKQHGETVPYKCGTKSIEVTCDDGVWKSDTTCSLFTNSTRVSTTDVANTNMLFTDVKTSEVLTTDETATEVFITNVSTVEVPTADLATTDASTAGTLLNEYVNLQTFCTIVLCFFCFT